MLRNASRRSGMHPDAQKDFHVLRIAQTPQNWLNLFQQILSMVAKCLKLKRASRSHAKTGSQNHVFFDFGPFGSPPRLKTMVLRPVLSPQRKSIFGGFFLFFKGRHIDLQNDPKMDPKMEPKMV